MEWFQFSCTKTWIFKKTSIVMFNIVILISSGFTFGWTPNKSSNSSFSCRTFGFCKTLLMCVLLWVYFFIKEVSCQLIPIVYLNLQEKESVKCDMIWRRQHSKPNKARSQFSGVNAHKYLTPISAGLYQEPYINSLTFPVFVKGVGKGFLSCLNTKSAIIILFGSLSSPT